jgi:hypothetical protein
MGHFVQGCIRLVVKRRTDVAALSDVNGLLPKSELSILPEVDLVKCLLMMEIEAILRQAQDEKASPTDIILAFSLW